MATPVVLSRVPAPRIGDGSLSRIQLGFNGINIVGRQRRTGKVEITNHFYKGKAVTRVVAQKATTKRYTGWLSTEQLGHYDALLTLRNWSDNDYRVICNDEPEDDEWEILDFEENERKAYGRDRWVVDFTLMLIRR